MRSLLLVVVAAAACVLAPSAAAGGESITACVGTSPGSCVSSGYTTASGVYFVVVTGGGNRDYATVAVSCTDAGGAIVYSTSLTVVVSPKGTGASQTIYPPAGSCTASLLRQQAIGRSRTLATTSFTVSA